MDKRDIESFYFLHIRHTGGKALYKNVLNHYFYPEQKNLKLEEYIGNHQGWHSKIDEKTYIFCVVREPIELICSLMMNTLYLYLIKEFESDEIIQKEFVNIVKSKKVFHNFQCRNILTGGGVKYDEIYEFDVDENLLKNRISRINLLISQDFLKKNMDKVADKIALDFGIDSIEIKSVNQNEFTNEKSKELYMHLTKKQKDEIKQYLEYDYILYNHAKQSGY